MTTSGASAVGPSQGEGSPRYVVGNTYSRNDVYGILSIPTDKRGGDWLTGYHRHGSDVYIFCNVGVAGRTGHDYDNHWDGEKLVWHGKNQSTFKNEVIEKLASGELRALVFYRKDDRSRFTYAGVGTPNPHKSTAKPVRIDWTFGPDGSASYPDEVPAGTTFKEGQRTQVYVNRYERDRDARDACVQHHGPDCAVCGFNFYQHYGEMGQGFIHVHHLVLLSTIGESYEVDPIKDLAPVCPNCHAMLHRGKTPPTVAELREVLAARHGSKKTACGSLAESTPLKSNRHPELA